MLKIIDLNFVLDIIYFAIIKSGYFINDKKHSCSVWSRWDAK